MCFITLDAYSTTMNMQHLAKMSEILEIRQIYVRKNTGVRTCYNLLREYRVAYLKARLMEVQATLSRALTMCQTLHNIALTSG